MRSPGDSSFPAISEPPTKMVPSTMPAGTGRLWVLPHCGSRPPPWVLPPVGPLTIESQVGEPLEGGDAQPQPLAQLARALRLGAVQPVGGGVTAPRPARAPPPRATTAGPHRVLTPPAGPPWRRRARCGRSPAPHRPPRWPWPPAPRGTRGMERAAGGTGQPRGVAGEGRGVYLLLCPAGEAAEEGAHEGAGAHQRGHDEEEEAGELGREQVERDDAARRLGAAAQALRRMGSGHGRAPGWGPGGRPVPRPHLGDDELEGGLELLDVGRQPVHQLPRPVGVIERHVLPAGQQRGGPGGCGGTPTHP